MDDESIVQGKLATPQKDEYSLFHHRKKLVSLDWPSEPSKVAIFLQKNLEFYSESIELLKQFIHSLNIEYEFDTYTDSDFIILVGTDGFNLSLNLLFQDRDTPPILSLTPNKTGFISFIEFCTYNSVIPQVLRGNCWLLPRTRLHIEHHSANGIATFTALNDLVLSRNSTSGPLLINCSSCGFCFSKIIADGAIIATATGSTAYNKAAGGSLVHPLLPVFILTPIGALSLSARPVTFPQSADLTLSLEFKKYEEQSAYFNFDGTGHRPFLLGEKLFIRLSNSYYNSIVVNKSIAEWPVRLAGLMGWNDRRHQKEIPKYQKI